MCYKAAQKNVQINGLTDKIEVKLVKSEDGKLAKHIGKIKVITFHF